MWAAAEQTEGLEDELLSVQRVLSQVILLCYWSVLDFSLCPSSPTSTPPLSPQPPFSASSLLANTLTSSPRVPSCKSLLQNFSFPSFGLHPLSLQLGEPQHLQTSKQSRGSCYHGIMRLSAPKLKEAIFCSCQLIIEEGMAGWRDVEGGGGRIIPIPLEAGEEWR